MMRLYILLLLLLGSLQVVAQSDSLMAVGYLKKAVAFSEQGMPDSAALYHGYVLGLYRQLDMPYDALRSYRMVYIGLQKKGKPLVFIDSLVAGLTFPWRAPANEEEYYKLSYQYLYIANAFRRDLSDIVSAKFYYEKSFEIFSAHLKENNDRIAEYLYHPLGNTYTRLGDYPRAKYLLHRNIAYGEAHQIPAMQTNYSDLAIVYHEEGLLDSAIYYLEKGIRHPASPLLYKCVSSILLGDYYTEAGKPDIALATLAQVPGLLTQLDTILPANKLQVRRAEYHQSLARAYKASGDPGQGLAQFQTCLNLYLETDHSIPNRNTGKLYNELSTLLLLLDREEEALAATQSALRYVLPSFHPADDLQLPEPASFYAENTIVEALLQKALCLEKMGVDQPALECYLLLPAVEGKLRENYQFESASLRRLAENRLHMETGIQIARRLYEKTGDEVFAAKAFTLTEYVRNAILLDNMAAATAATQLPDSLQVRMAGLQSRINWYEQEIAIAKENDPSRESALENSFFLLKQQNSQLQHTMEDNFPAYGQFRQLVTIASVEDITDLLAPGQAFLGYFIIGEVLHIFSKATEAPFQWRSSPLPPDFWLEAESLSDYISSEQNSFVAKDKFAVSSHALYRLLLEPALKDFPATVDRLYIVPDGVLSFIPFEIFLTSPAVPGTGFGEMPFLIKKYALAYGSSVTLWMMQQALSKRPAAAKAFAGFAPMYKKEASQAVATRGEQDSGDSIQDEWLRELVRDGWYDLPGAREEVRRIAAVTGGVVYESEAAEKSIFLQTADQYRILHLAMHALSDRKNPALSRFIFTRPTGGSDQDYILYANELSQLRLRADLAVLSACNTGKGVLRKGEGVYSLARAFTMAGVPSVVMSLWRLPDNTTPDIIVAFYEHLKAGDSKDLALQQAKLSWLEKHTGEPLLLHPFYWAGLTATGVVGEL